MTKIAVIGVGSPFGNDTIAYKVISLLKQEPSLTAELQYYDRPGWHLLEYMKPFNTVHLVDAMISGKTPGTLHRYEDIHAFQLHQNRFSSHDFGLAETLLLGEALEQLPANLVIHGIEISVESDNNSPPYFGLVKQIKQEIVSL